MDGTPVDEILGDEAGEREQAGDAVLQGVSGAQKQKRNQCDGDLNANGVFGCTEEVPNFETVLDPSEEQLDLPASLVEFGDFVGGRVQIIGDDTQDFAGLGAHAQFADRVLENGIFAPTRLARWQMADAVGENRRARRQAIVCGPLQAAC